MFAWAAVGAGTCGRLVAESAHLPVRPTEHAAGLLAAFLILRAFAQGCTALTGVEAISYTSSASSSRSRWLRSAWSSTGKLS
jgi:hypothetical protein